MQFIRICENNGSPKQYIIPIQDCVFEIYVYQPVSEDLEDTELNLASQQSLPASCLEGLWENLVFEPKVKKSLLGFMKTCLIFGDRGVDPKIISVNKLILIHGPPGYFF